MRILTLILFILPLISNGQSSIARTAELQKVYLNVRNPILFNHCDRTPKDSFWTSNGTLEVIHDTLFVTPTNLKEPTIVSLFRSYQEKIIDKAIFKTTEADTPHLLEKPIQGAAHEICCEGIKWSSETKLELTFPTNLSHLKLDTCSRILSFKITLLVGNGTYDETFVSHSDTIPKAFRDKWNSLKQDARKIEDRIRCKVKVQDILVFARWVSKEPFYLDDYINEWSLF